jgi:hypothetical protein
MNRTYIEIGYWNDANNRFPNLPMPQSFVDIHWDGEERRVVGTYLNAGQELHAWRGFSHCRICGLTPNGSRCLTDGVYQWPSGFGHYVIAHGVKPPQAFIDHVRSRGGR